MSKKTTLQLDALMRAIHTDGTYTTLTDIGERMVDFIGLEPESFGLEFYVRHVLTLRQAARIRKIADAVDYDLPEWFDELVEQIKEERSYYKFTNKRGETLIIDADFSQAACPIRAKYDGYDWFGTPFQVADARHNPHAACRLVANWQ